MFLSRGVCYRHCFSDETLHPDVIAAGRKAYSLAITHVCFHESEYLHEYLHESQYLHVSPQFFGFFDFSHVLEVQSDRDCRAASKRQQLLSHRTMALRTTYNRGSTAVAKAVAAARGAAPCPSAKNVN
jgi:hypothetical protein